MNNEVENIKSEIIAIAKTKGLFLHRWQTNHSNHAKTITYALHNNSDKPIKSLNTSGYVFSMSTDEGKTKKCNAYKNFEQMLKHLKE